MSSVLQVITGTQRRGAEVFGFDLGVALSARGHAGRTVALTGGPGGARLPVEALGDTRLGPATIGRLRGALRGVQVAVAHGSSTLPACGLAALGSGTPFVYRSIGDPSYWSNTLARRLRVGLYLSRAAAVVALWPAAADELSRRFQVPRDRVHVIPNGVVADRFRPASKEERLASRERFELDPDGPVIVYVGSLSPEKGVDVALRAVADLGDAQLLLVGDGPDRAALARLAADSAPGRVRFAGALDDPAVALAAADAVVVPSRTEGLPASAIEAGLCGLPVVACDVGGLGEVVDRGRSGLLVPAGDHAALVDGLRRVLADPGDMGPRARERCLARFEMGAVADAWSAMLDGLVG